MAESTIAPKVLAELNLQLNHELAAAHAYQALSLWCADENLTGFANFFARQAGEEREHAEKIADHLLDRGSRPKLDAIAAPKQNFKSLLEVAQQAQAMEKANTRGINAVYDAAAATKDYPGVTGIITIDANHDAVKPAVVLEVKDGKSVYVTTVAP